MFFIFNILILRKSFYVFFIKLILGILSSDDWKREIYCQLSSYFTSWKKKEIEMKRNERKRKLCYVQYV